MGNSHQQHQNSIKHPQFKNCRINKNKMIIEQKMPSNYQDWKKRHQILKKIGKDSPLLLGQTQQTHQQKWCGIQKKVNIIIDIFSDTLDQQIIKRRKINQKFSQQEIWFLLYQLLWGSSLFQKKRLKSGDIRPANILIDPNGQIKIINVYSFLNQATNYQKSFYLKTKTYLAPQELSDIEQSMQFSRFDPSTAQAFSIGLTIMDTILLANSQELYDMNNISFKNYQFNDNILALKNQNLSSFLIKTVLNLLQVNPVFRPNPGQALAILSPYQTQILNLSRFEPDRQKSKEYLQRFQQNCGYR